jgi:hypothetical protein
MLFLLPDELLVAIAEYCDQKTRKDLSLVSRRLRNPSQCIIFNTVCISRKPFETIVPRFAVQGGGHLPEVIQNDRLLSYIQTFAISLNEVPHLLETNIMAPVFTALHRMQQLRDIKLFQIPFTTTMLDRFCEVLSTRLYNVELWTCSYPTDYTIQHAALKIHRLRLALEREWIDGVPPPTTTKALVEIIERSLSSIASLTLSSGLGILAYLGTMPQLTSLNILLKSGRNDGGLRLFLVANPQLVEFALDGGFYDLPLLPPSALPNLRTIHGTAKLIKHLLPGRPVAKVEICKSSKFKIMVDGLRALSHSAALIVELTLHLHHYFAHLYDILDAVVKTCPRLERMWLSFQVEVRRILY